MILHVFLLVILGPLALVSCQSDSGDEKITPFTLNDLDSILASTDATLYPISGTCHEEGAVIALTVNDTFSNTSEAPPQHFLPAYPSPGPPPWMSAPWETEP